MDNQQAKFILQSYRKNGVDASDAQFAAALAHAAQDPTLAAWLEDDQVCDETIRRKLAEVSVPSDLRESILQGQIVIPLVQPRRSWVAPAWAAAIALLCTMAAIWWTSSHGPDRMTMADYEGELVGELYRPISFDFSSTDPAAIRSWLSTNSALGEFTIPERLTGLPCVGCDTLVVNGRPVALVCFRISNDEVVHLFVMSSAGLEGVRTIASARRAGDFRTLSWRQDGHVYVLAGRRDEQELRKLVEG